MDLLEFSETFDGDLEDDLEDDREDGRSPVIVRNASSSSSELLGLSSLACCFPSDELEEDLGRSF